MPRMGLPPWTSGFSPFGVLVASTLPPFRVSQHQPEPNWVTPALSTEPNESLSALSTSPGILPPPLGLHPAPKVNMVEVLAGVIEYGRVLAERAFDDLLEGLALPFSALERGVAVVDVSQMVLVVMVFQRFTRHIGAQRVIGVGQIGQRETHGTAPWRG